MDVAVDTNRLVRPTQRRFNAAWMECSDETLKILPQVAIELTHGKYLADLEFSLEQARHALASIRNRGDQHTAFIVECDIWWLRELLRNDSPYALLELTPEEYEQSAEIRQAFPADAFPAARKHEVASDSDAVIVSQGIVKQQNLLITSDSNTIKVGRFNEWLQSKGNELGVRAAPILFVQDDIMPQLFADKEHELLCIALAASWPHDRYAAIEIIRQQFDGQLKAMQGALLEKTARTINAAWRKVTDIEQLLSYVREAYFPHKTLASEARHPGSRVSKRGSIEQ